MPTIARRPNHRWVVPAAAAGLVVAGPALWTSFATAEPVLPPRSAEEIVADVLAAEPVALSGELSQRVDLGLPNLGYEPGVDFTSPGAIWSLFSGTNTWRVWYDGDDSYRVAIVRGTTESDLISNGEVAWVWASQSQTAIRHELPAGTADRPLPAPVESPADAAKQVLTRFEQYSAVGTDANVRVAGRAAYELVVTPNDANTRVAQVRLAIDAETNIPLRVQVFSTISDDPVAEIGFTKVNYGVPNASVFEFTPPPGAEVIESSRPEVAPAELPGPKPGVPAPKPEPSIEGEVVPHDAGQLVGEGWSTVMVMTSQDAGDLAAFPLLESLPRVSGDWGSGVVLDGTLISAVFADDGRVAVGAVAPDALYEALAR